MEPGAGCHHSLLPERHKWARVLLTEVLVLVEDFQVLRKCYYRAIPETLGARNTMSKKFRLPLLVILFFLAVGGVLLALTKRSTNVDAADKTVAASSTTADAVPANAPMKLAPAAVPGTVSFTAAKGDTVPGTVRKYLWSSKYITASEFEKALREANGGFKGVFWKPGDNIVVPGIEEVTSEKLHPVPADYEVRAIYLTGLMAASEKGVNIVREWRKVGGNAVVFDIKDSDGWVNINFDNKLVPAGHKPPIKNLAKYARWLHAMGMHAIAREAIFRDEALVAQHPELAVHSRKSGQPWRENGKLVWTDTSNPEVQAYNIALAKHAAESGIDEIQFDYVRFPAEGDQKDAKFYFEKDHPDWKRTDVITDFLRKAYAELHPTGVLLSLDVFGVMAWQRNVDLAHTGQDIPNMAKYCDVMSPMIYPSHFFGMDGYTMPGDAPEHFISSSMDRFGKITAGSGVVLRPWLQAFGWKTKTYSPEYIEVQVKVAKARGGNGLLFWNARNDYTKPFVAMPEMRGSKQIYFRGDELSEAGKEPLQLPTQIAQ